MLYDVSLRIEYIYDRQADAGRCLLRLLPADLPGRQRVIAGYLDVQPRPSERSQRRDYFGNNVTEISYRSEHARIQFGLNCRVERTEPVPSLDISPPLDRLAQEIADLRSLAPDAPHHFLRASPRVRAHAVMTEYALDVLHPDMTAQQAVAAIGLALHRDMQFDPEATDVDTPPEDAFARRRGVCQDFSHIMIACLRGVGVPAGYVSGYLRTNPPEGQPRLEGADAMHAWVRAWCGAELGWVEYDPTNAIVVGGDHIIVAHGRDYSDVAPVKGVLRSAGGQTSEQAVDVVLLDG